MLFPSTGNALRTPPGERALQPELAFIQNPFVGISDFNFHSARESTPATLSREAPILMVRFGGIAAPFGRFADFSGLFPATPAEPLRPGRLVRQAKPPARVVHGFRNL